MKRRIIYTLAFLFATMQIIAQTTMKYKYDDNYRLTQVTYSNGMKVFYTYDELGNRLTKKVTNAVSFQKGDVDGDGTINTTDIVEVVNFIMNKTSNNINEMAADVNEDGTVNAADIVSIVNIIPDNNNTQQDVPAEAVDLGLPSGTLWASCNVGATKPEEMGGYYAWGETEEKAEYTKDTYLYWSNQFNGGDDIGENICGTNYDVAHVKWSQGWQMPDLDQIKELLENCSHEVVEQNNVKGMKFTGTNGNSIFLPITGLYIGNKVYGKDDYCVYWTGIPPTPLGTAVYYLYVDGKGETHWDYLPENRYYRYYGMPIRPVINSKLAGPGTDTIGGGDEV